MTDPVILAFRATMFLCGMVFLLGAALCAVQVIDPDGSKTSLARRLLKTISSSLRALWRKQAGGARSSSSA
jgi:hypothetical protein